MRLCEPCISTLPTDIDADEIIRKACEYFDIPRKKLASKSRKREVVEPRQMVMTLLTYRTKLTLKAIGAKFRRHHTTVLKSRRAYKNLSDSDPDYRYRFTDMQKFVFKN